MRQICERTIILLLNLTMLLQFLEKLRGLNHALVQKDKLQVLIKKLKLLKSNLQKKELNKFSLSKDFWATANIEASKNPFIEHLDGLVLHFSNYFKNLDLLKVLWIQN